MVKFRYYVLVFVVLLVGACRPAFEGRPTAFPTPTLSPTLALEPSSTPTEVSTVTLTPTNAPTPTPTLLPSATPTYTPTAIPTHLAQMLDLYIGEGLVDWSYTYLTFNEQINDVQRNLSALMAFQLIDRGIHRETINLIGNEITVYYLNAQHNFNGEMIPVRLILTGVFGRDIPIENLLADGANFVFYRAQNNDAPFEPWTFYADWNLEAEEREQYYQALTLMQFQDMLDQLPEEFMLFAHHPVIIEPDGWEQVDINMERLSGSGARFSPFFAFDGYERLIGQTSLATILQQYLVKGSAIPGDMYDKLRFSADFIVVITP